MAMVTVRINGMEYNLKGKEDEKYLQHLASYVEDKLQEILQKNTKLSVSAASILTAINLADESFKGKKELTNILETHELLKRANKSIQNELEGIKQKHNVVIAAKDNELAKVVEKLNKDNELIKVVGNLKNETNILKSEIEKVVKAKKIIEDEKNRAEETNAILVLEKQRLEEDKLELQEELNNEMQNNSSESLEVEAERLKQQLSLLEAKNEKLENEKKLATQEKENLKNENDLLKQANKEMKFSVQSSKYRIIDLENKFLESQITIATEKAKKKSMLLKTSK
ncbi:MAG: cell division protein ZapA [Sarcina sp.]